jgi:hypothetical protein
VEAEVLLLTLQSVQVQPAAELAELKLSIQQTAQSILAAVEAAAAEADSQPAVMEDLELSSSRIQTLSQRQHLQI